ncbi:MAG TPA: hypothetical protein VHG30_08570 [Microvirga sp.]|nr:hypothetical protein [Microvirga sp.]
MWATTAEHAVDAFIDRVAYSKPFSIAMPDGRVRRVGDGEPVFRATLRNDRAVKAVRSLDEGNLAEAYMRGDIDLDGDMLEPFALRASLHDRHFVTNAWRFLQPLLFGQVYTNKRAIASHYDVDPRLFLSFPTRPIPPTVKASTRATTSRWRRRWSGSSNMPPSAANSAPASASSRSAPAGAPSRPTHCGRKPISPASPSRPYRKTT